MRLRWTYKVCLWIIRAQPATATYIARNTRHGSIVYCEPGTSMRSALYYPHTTVNCESIVKTALLLWDHLEFIVPFRSFEPHYENPTIARAMELIGLPHPPNQEEKQEAHTRIEE